MKNARALILLLSAICVSGCHSSGTKATDPAATLAPCLDGIMTVEDQPGAPARLSVTKAGCEGSVWGADLTITNTGTKPIIGGEIAYVEDYEIRKGVSSSQSDGFTIGEGESKVIHANGGFGNGLSYGKPVGALKRITFRATQIRFSGGTTWGQLANLGASQYPQSPKDAR